MTAERADYHAYEPTPLPISDAQNNVPQQILAETIFDLVPLSDAIVDHTYARRLAPVRVRRLQRATYVPEKVGMLYVSRRVTGEYAVIDGQWRTELARRAGISRLPARVYVGLTIEKEAELYLAFNRDRSATTPLDDYFAELEAHVPEAFAIQALLDSLGLRIEQGSDRAGGLQCVAVIRQVYREWGPVLLRSALELVLEVWGMEKRALIGEIIGGFAAFLIRYPDLSPKQRTDLVDRLRAFEPKRFRSRAASRREENPSMTLSAAIGRTMLAIYNHGRHVNLLDPWVDRVNPRQLRPQAE